jgi:tetratricopeptide (TPR) repeat protein
MNYTKYIFILLIGGALCSPFSVFAQKKRNKVETVLTERDSLRLDALFIDATTEFLNGNYRDAIKGYEKVKKGYPQDGAVYHQLAKCYGGLLSYQKAIIHEEIAVELDSKNKYYYLYLTTLYREVKAWQEMAVCYDAMLKNTKGAEEYYYDLGHLYAYFFLVKKRSYVYAKQDPDNNYNTQKIPKKERKKMDELVQKALTAYEAYEKNFGISEVFIYDKQEILLGSEQIDQAIAEGEKLIIKYPENVTYILRNANFYSENIQYQRAIDYLLTKQQTNTDYRIILALISNYEELGQTEKIKETIAELMKSKDAPLSKKTKILLELIKKSSNKESMDYILKLAVELEKTHPDNSDVKFLLADVYFFNGEMTKSRNEYLKALLLNEDNKYAWQQVLGIDMKLENYPFLKEDALKALSIFPKESVFHYWLASAYLDEKSNDDAIQSLNTAKELTKNPELTVRILAELGGVYNKTKEYEKSDNAYDEALVYSPNNALVLNNYSYYLSVRKEHLHKAKSMARRLIMLYPNESSYLDTYGWVLYQMKQYKEASLYLEKAASQSQSPTIYDHYGDVLFRLKKTDEAVIWWKKAKEAGVSSTVIDKKIADKKLYEK